MTSKERQITRIKQVSTIIQTLPEANSIRDLSKKTGFSEGTIQTLLHRPDLIIEALGLDNTPEITEKITTKINEWFEKNRKEGFRRGAAKSHTMLGNHPKIKRK